MNTGFAQHSVVFDFGSTECWGVGREDDELDADDMRRNRGVDGFGKNGGLSSRKGKGNTNIVGAVLGVLGMFVFVGIVSGVWFYCKSKEKAFVSV